MVQSPKPSERPDESPQVVLFAGGGSGGHIAPGLAIAERLAAISPKTRCVFACSTRPVDAHMLHDADRSFVPIDAAPLSTRPKGVWRFARGTLRATSQVRELIREQQVNRVVLLGGFVAAPVAWVAPRMGIATTLINLDIPPGKANRWMARRVSDIISAIPVPPSDGESISELPPPFDQQIVATPVRHRAIADRDAAACRLALNLDPDRPTLLITGASQGATSINQLMTAVAQRHSDWLDGWQVLHLAGRDDCDAVAAAYREVSVPAVVLSFLDEIGLAWGAADLAISRAGANSVAEVAANAVPTLFLPYPWHADQHQRRNAQPLADRSAAVITDDSIDPQSNLESIGPVLRELLSDANRRESMRDALHSHQPIDGALAIAQHLAAANLQLSQESR